MCVSLLHSLCYLFRLHLNVIDIAIQMKLMPFKTEPKRLNVMCLIIYFFYFFVSIDGASCHLKESPFTSGMHFADDSI